MNKVKAKKGTRKHQSAGDLKQGQVGIIADHEGDYAGRFIMRTYTGLVSLSTGDTWGKLCGLSLSHIVQPGEVVEITIGE